jgi:hypothetical protein
MTLTRNQSDQIRLEYPGNAFKISFRDNVANTSNAVLYLGKGSLFGGDVYIGSGMTPHSNGFPNVIVGSGAYANGGGSGHAVIGANALRQLSSGEANSAFGAGAGGDLGNGAGNIFVSASGLSGNDHVPWNGSNNVFLGFNSATNISSDSPTLNNNTFVGSYTADTQSLSGGEYNTLLGSRINVPIPNGSYQLNIGNAIFGTDISGTGYNVSPGKIGIGTPTPTARFTVHENAGENNASLLDISSSASGPSTVFYSVDSKGHHVYKGVAPTTSACGTGATVTGNDSRGRVTVGSGSGANCTVVFAHTWSSAPVCQVTKETGPFRNYRVVPTASGFTITASGNIGADTFAYACDGI